MCWPSLIRRWQVVMRWLYDIELCSASLWSQRVRVPFKRRFLNCLFFRQKCSLSRKSATLALLERSKGVMLEAATSVFRIIHACNCRCGLTKFTYWSEGLPNPRSHGTFLHLKPLSLSLSLIFIEASLHGLLMGTKFTFSESWLYMSLHMCTNQGSTQTCTLMVRCVSACWGHGMVEMPRRNGTHSDQTCYRLVPHHALRVEVVGVSKK